MFNTIDPIEMIDTIDTFDTIGLQLAQLKMRENTK